MLFHSYGKLFLFSRYDLAFSIMQLFKISCAYIRIQKCEYFDNAHSHTHSQLHTHTCTWAHTDTHARTSAHRHAHWRERTQHITWMYICIFMCKRISAYLSFSSGNYRLKSIWCVYTLYTLVVREWIVLILPVGIINAVAPKN